MPIGDILHHTYNPSNLALIVEVSLTVPLHPNDVAVETQHSIGNLEFGVLRTQGGNRSLNFLSVVRVNPSQYLLPSGLYVFIIPKYPGEVFRAHDDIGSNVPLIGEHLPRLRRQTKPFFAL